MSAMLPPAALQFDYPGWPFEGLKPHGYRAILIDCPWDYQLWSASGEGKSAQSHYDCMDMDALKALPIGQLAADGCMIFMWCTAPMLDQQIELMKHWGFKYKTMGAWAKRSSTDKAWHFGTGYILRGAIEPFIIGTINKHDFQTKSQRNLIVAPVREHSRKPEDQYSVVEAMSHGPYCEVFSRCDRPGWDCWGNEAGKFNSKAGDEVI